MTTRTPILQRMGPVPAGTSIGQPQAFVLDTKVIYDDIVYRLRNPGRRGVLLGASDAGAIELLAADHVYDEVYDSLVGHQRRGVTREAVVACFERMYLPRIRFVDIPVWPVPTRAVAVGLLDIDDVPTAILALHVAPCLVLASDPHLVECGFGVADEWLRLAWQADELLGHDGVLLLSALGARAAWRQLTRGGRWLMKDMGAAEVALSAALAAATVAYAPQLAESMAEGARRLGAGAGRVALEVAAGLAHVARERGERASALQAAAVAPDDAPPLTARIARALAVARGGATVEDLAAVLGSHEPDVAAALRSSRAFVRRGGTWELGRRRLPRGRALPAGPTAT